MTIPLSPAQLSARLDDIIRSELTYRLSAPTASPRLDDLITELESHNREVVRRHQDGSLGDALPSLFSTALALQPGGRLHARRPSVQLGGYERYRQAAERFDTLFTSGLMALSDPAPADVMHRHLALFHEKNDRLSLILRHLEETKILARKVHSLVPESPGVLAGAAAFLSETAAPREDEIRRIRHSVLAFSSDAYMEKALSRLNKRLFTIESRLRDKTRKAVGFLGDEAGRLFQEFKATPVDAAHLPALMNCQEELVRLADFFQAARLPDREKQIRDMIGMIKGAVNVIRQEMDRQKTREAHHYQRKQAHLDDLRDRFARIQEDFSAGRFDSAGKRKKLGRELHRLIKSLNAAGLTEVIADIHGFMAATGIGREVNSASGSETNSDFAPKPGPAAPGADGGQPRHSLVSPFYRKGFFFLLLLNILLLIATVLLTGFVI